MRPIDRYAAALRHTLRASLALGAELTDAQWRAPTECPLWTVGDIYAHLVGGELWAAEGFPAPTGPFQEWVDGSVLKRRGRPRHEVLAELAALVDTREAQLAELPDSDTPATYPWGEPTTFDQLLATRVLDCWVHEQDIRRAVGRPGNLGSPAARVTRDQFLGLLPRLVARRAGAPPGTAVRWTVLGDLAVDVTVAVDDSRRGRLVPPAEAGPATGHVTLGWESYARLSAGRGERADHQAWVTGDSELAQRILASLAVTP